MHEANRALVIGESAEWRERVCAALGLAQLSVEACASGKEALARPDAIQLVVVAGQTSDLSGVALCRRMRELPGGDEFTLIVISALSDEMDRILAFENGADDFVAEPFSARELAARVQAILRRRRRRGRGQLVDEVDAGMLRLDLPARVAALNGRRIVLTSREFEVLKYLATSGGRVVRRVELLRALDGDSRASERLIDTHVKSIRQKLGGARDLIETVRGVGYRFDARARRDGEAPRSS